MLSEGVAPDASTCGKRGYLIYLRMIKSFVDLSPEMSSNWVAEMWRKLVIVA